MSTANTIAWAQFSDQRPVSQLLMDSPDMRVIGFCLKAGQTVSPHRSPYRVFMTVLQGRGHMLAGENERPVRMGDWAACEPNELHGFTAEEDMVVMAVIAPSPSKGISLKKE